MTALASSKLRFKCPICESIVERQSRTQVYCSPKCMRKGNYARKAGLGLLLGQHTAGIRTSHKIESKNNVLQWPQTPSSPCRTDGIVGPRKVIRAEVINGRDWEEIVSSDGVRSYVSRLTIRALRDGSA
jgi:hypothetical protein